MAINNPSQSSDMSNIGTCSPSSIVVLPLQNAKQILAVDMYPAPILIKLSRKALPASTSANPAPFRDTWRAFFKLLILTHGGSYGLMVYLSPSRSRQEALSNNTSFEYEQTCVTAVGSVSSPFSQLEEMARFCIKHQLMANSQVHLSIFECMVVEMIFSLCNMCYLPTENLLVASNILKIADFGLASEVASMPPQKCRTSFSAMSASLPAHQSA
ncbi:hypothetical protein F2Q70_00013396 [Brassica cretica]|uniref:Protein kinase domain-containing protein n=1 Tax=Brassica cretica TaxID=69181 RepID=A0A8S9LUK6_BRACR|nr:hypothetical protein F2Q70_00013396 [Brassica cretica]